MGVNLGLVGMMTGLGKGLTDFANTNLEVLKMERLAEFKQGLEDNAWTKRNAVQRTEKLEDRAYGEQKLAEQLQRKTTWSDIPGTTRKQNQEGETFDAYHTPEKDWSAWGAAQNAQMQSREDIAMRREEAAARRQQARDLMALARATDDPYERDDLIAEAKALMQTAPASSGGLLGGGGADGGQLFELTPEKRAAFEAAPDKVKWVEAEFKHQGVTTPIAKELAAGFSADLAERAKTTPQGDAAPAARPAPPQATPSPKHIQMLLSNAGTDAQFDARYGAGAAAKVRAQAAPAAPTKTNPERDAYLASLGGQIRKDAAGATDAVVGAAKKVGGLLEGVDPNAAVYRAWRTEAKQDVAAMQQWLAENLSDPRLRSKLSADTLRWIANIENAK